jgi:hypothetical protein
MVNNALYSFIARLLFQYGRCVRRLAACKGGQIPPFGLPLVTIQAIGVNKKDTGNVICEFLHQPQGMAHSSGGWLVSGGVGALGALMSAWLARSGAPRLCLLGRSGRAAGENAKALAPLLAGDCTVTLSR